MISLKNIGKIYQRNDGASVLALRDVSFEVQRGEFVTLRGPSGSGKSSLLNIIGCLDRPTSGTFELEGIPLAGLADSELSQIRSRRIGFVFQAFHLLPRSTALENVELPMIYSGRPVDRTKALEALARVGLRDRADHYSAELSGGQQQRVALARALSNDPALILADEPTGNLDSAAGHEVMSLLVSLNEEGRTIVLVTHDDAVAAYASREIRLADSRVVEDRSARAEPIAGEAAQ
jgi:putative ABC transport system ATP-binding protein